MVGVLSGSGSVKEGDRRLVDGPDAGRVKTVARVRVLYNIECNTIGVSASSYVSCKGGTPPRRVVELV